VFAQVVIVPVVVMVAYLHLVCELTSLKKNIVYRWWYLYIHKDVVLFNLKWCHVIDENRYNNSKKQKRSSAHLVRIQVLRICRVRSHQRSSSRKQYTGKAILKIPSSLCPKSHYEESDKAHKSGTHQVNGKNNIVWSGLTNLMDCSCFRKLKVEGEWKLNTLS